MALSPKTKRAIQKYGLEVCKKAYEKHQEGDGANTISWEVDGLKGGCTRQADAAINAYEEYLVQQEAPVMEKVKVTPSQQKYIDMIRKNHKTDVEISKVLWMGYPSEI
jgi:hypothetical protein